MLLLLTFVEKKKVKNISLMSKVLQCFSDCYYLESYTLLGELLDTDSVHKKKR